MDGFLMSDLLHGGFHQRFWSKVIKTSDCWLWTAATDKDGYGVFWVDGHNRKARAHRVAYEMLHGTVPDGLHLDHLCRVRACVRPDHLEAVTPAENIRRGETGRSNPNSQKSHCVRGHPFDEANTYIRTNGNRRCRTCFRAYHAELKRRKRDAVRQAAA